MIDIPIVFEDDSLLVVNKPPGIVVNRADSVKTETVQDWVEKRVNSEQKTANSEIEKEFVNRSGVVHRIDKETSGCLLIAKSANIFESLKQQFMDRTIKKTYLALAHGNIVPQIGEIRAPVGRLPWNRERFGIVPGGKEAVTRYKVQGKGVRQKGKEKIEYSVVELYPETGRTHQIRVHLKYINHPIIGDYLYAGRKTARNDRQWAPRVMLHAWKIIFEHPVDKNSIFLEAEVPEDMKDLI